MSNGNEKVATNFNIRPKLDERLLKIYPIPKIMPNIRLTLISSQIILTSGKLS